MSEQPHTTPAGTRTARQRLLRPLAYAALIIGAAAILSIANFNTPSGTPTRADAARATPAAANALRAAGLLDGWRVTATTRTDPPAVVIRCRPIAEPAPAIPSLDQTSAALAHLSPPVPVRIEWRTPGNPATTHAITPRAPPDTPAP